MFLLWFPCFISFLPLWRAYASVTSTYRRRADPCLPCAGPPPQAALNLLSVDLWSYVRPTGGLAGDLLYRCWEAQNWWRSSHKTMLGACSLACRVRRHMWTGGNARLPSYLCRWRVSHWGLSSAHTHVFNNAIEDMSLCWFSPSASIPDVLLRGVCGVHGVRACVCVFHARQGSPEPKSLRKIFMFHILSL